MSNEAHCIVRIAFQRQFYDANDFVFRGIGQILVLIIVFLISGVEDQQFDNLPSVGRTQAGLLADLHVIFQHAPQFYLVMLIHSQENVFLFHINRIPNAGRWITLLLNRKNRFQFQSIVLVF